MEKWDIYDKDRNKINMVVNSDETLKDNQYRLVVHVCIFNSDNEMLIQRRHPSKSLYPDLWDVTVSGSVKTNEDTRKAGEREVLEELGCRIDLSDTRTSITFNFDQGFDDFYLIKKDLNLADLTLKTNEVTEVKWAKKYEIIKLIEEDLFVPYHKSVIELLFFNKDDMKIHTV